MLVGGKRGIFGRFNLLLMMPIGYGHIWKCSNTPFSFSSHLTPSGPAGRNEWFWHLGACMTTHGIWSLPLLLYWFIIQKEFFTAKSFGSVRGKGAWNILFLPPPDKWYRCGCYLPDGFDSSLPQERHSTFWPMTLRRACLAQPLRRGKILGELQGVQPPHPGRFPKASWSLSLASSVQSLSLFGSLMLFCSSHWCAYFLCSDLWRLIWWRTVKHYDWAWAGEFKAFVKRLFTNTLTNVGRKDARLLNVALT